MKRRILTLLGVIAVPVGAILLSACGPEGMTDEVTLDEASDNWIFLNGEYSEYGSCNNAIDDNGDGLVDGHDPDCHINPGPLRDLSIYDFPQGHNFFPDITKIFPGGPGWPGGFRDPVQITRWFRFLNEPDGNVAGINIYDPGVNPAIVPVPELLPELIRQGTLHQGNNNNPSERSLHVTDLYHPVPPPVAVAGAAIAGAAVAGAAAAGAEAAGAAAAQAPSAGAVAAAGAAAANLDPGSRYNPRYKTTKPPRGAWPGVMYQAHGSPYTGVGSQGAQVRARTGNPDS